MDDFHKNLKGGDIVLAIRKGRTGKEKIHKCQVRHVWPPYVKLDIVDLSGKATIECRIDEVQPFNPEYYKKPKKKRR